MLVLITVEWGGRRPKSLIKQDVSEWESARDRWARWSRPKTSSLGFKSVLLSWSPVTHLSVNKSWRYGEVGETHLEDGLGYSEICTKDWCSIFDKNVRKKICLNSCFDFYSILVSFLFYWNKHKPQGWRCCLHNSICTLKKKFQYTLKVTW